VAFPSVTNWPTPAATAAADFQACAPVTRRHDSACDPEQYFEILEIFLKDFLL